MLHDTLRAVYADYHIGLSLIAMVTITALYWVLGKAAQFVPAFRAATTLNKAEFAAKMKRPAYAANQAWNRKWSGIFLAVIFFVIVPFCITAEAQPWWRFFVDAFVILMVYDFVYYLTHRFAFHDGGPFNGPLMWMHAIHHRQHNPCRNDSSYIHPLEIAIGLGLYVATIFVLSRFMGDFHILTIIVTWTAFTQINQHNHNLWESEAFPFRYLNYAATMHHNHHARFTGGNYATITLLYDWMFGTLDHGTGARRKPLEQHRSPAPASEGTAAESVA